MITHEAIPFLDLVTPHRMLESELLTVVRKAFSTAGFIGGQTVQEFEAAFAGFCETRYCVGVNSGTDALRFALLAAGIGSGDVVVTVANTFIATTEAITQTGATPEFVDVDERTYNMDPEKLRAYLEHQCAPDEVTGQLISQRSGKRVAAIIPVHLFGQMADMDPILELGDKHCLAVIEDACQAHGAQYFSRKQNRWCKAGSMGLAAAFSFYPGKNLGACGEGGAVTTNSASIDRLSRQLRDHGQAKKYYHDMEGYNGRLDAIQAGFLKVKLPHLSEWNECRRAASERYHRLLEDSPFVRLPYEPAWSRAVYHLFVIRVEERDALISALSHEKIGTGIHYPIALHLQTAYKYLNYCEGDLQVSEKVTREIVSLPMFPTLTADQQGRVANASVRFLSQARPVNRSVESSVAASMRA
jgi:dTDP-4-amino-4,6-dideoxygalactose transaminase